MDWAPSSPDMNIIEHVWEYLDKRVHTRSPLPTNQDQMWTALEEEWANIDEEKLYKSMPDHVTALLKAKGSWKNIRSVYFILIKLELILLLQIRILYSRKNIPQLEFWKSLYHCFKHLNITNLNFRLWKLHYNDSVSIVKAIEFDFSEQGEAFNLPKTTYA